MTFRDRLKRLDALESHRDTPRWFGLPDTIEVALEPGQDEAAAIADAEAAWHATHPTPPGYRPGIDRPRLVIIVLAPSGDNDHANAS